MKRLLVAHCICLIPFFLPAQNIGIGTSIPAAKLDLRGAENTVHGKNAAINITNTLSANSWTLRAGATGTTTPNNGFSIGDNAGYRFVITSTGNIGIGTTTPQQNLSVYEGLNIDQQDINDGSLLNALHFGNNSGEAIGSKRTAGIDQHGLDFYTASLHRMTINNDGLIGINNHTPTSRLTIYHESPVDARGYPGEEHGFMIIDSSYSLGTAALYMGVSTVTNRAYITFNNDNHPGGVEPKLFINPMGNTTFIGGGWGSQNVPYALVVENKDMLVEEDLYVQDGKGIIRSADATQRKQLVKIITINTSFAAGETKSFAFTWPQTFGGPPDAYVGAVAPGSSNGWAEMIMTVAADNTTGGTLFVYNPKSTSVSPNFNIKIIGIGPQ